MGQGPEHVDFGAELDGGGFVRVEEEVAVFAPVEERALRDDEVGGEEDLGAEAVEEGV